MFVNIRQRATMFALFATLVLGVTLPARAQNTTSASTKKVQVKQVEPAQRPPVSYRPQGLPTRALNDSVGTSRTGMVPQRRSPMTGNATFIPAEVPVRTTDGVTGFSKKVSRVRIGGTNGASVTEKVVNLTQTPNVPVGTTANDGNVVIDERVPVWTVDERFLYFAGNTRQQASRYKLWRVASDEPTDAGANAPTAITNPADTTYDYYFPAINLNQTRVAFLRSSDGKDVDDATKKWDLCVSDLPANGQFIDLNELGTTNLRKLTEGRDFPNGNGGRAAFTTIGRPTWVGSTDVIFAAQLAGDPNFHLFSVNLQTRVIFQLTSGTADERNPSVSPDGRWVAFDSNAAAGSYVSDGTRRVRTETDPNATPSGASAVGTTRNVFTMTTLGQSISQFTLQYAGAPAVSSFHPTWSSTQRNNFTNPNGQDVYLGFASNRIPVFDGADTTQSSVLSWAQGPSGTSSVFYAYFSRNGGNTRLIEVEPTNLDGSASDGARRLDTSNDTLQGGVLNDQTKPRFADQYPTFAPFIKVIRLGYQSNRNGTYNKDGVGTGFTVTTAKENNVFVASLIDITAPTLIRFDTGSPTGEIVHVNLVTDDLRPYNGDIAASVRNRSDGITPGSKVHFAIRVEDRESGMRPENSPDGKAVYLQIKNPNSRYQSMAQGGNVPNDTHRGEHKEFFSGSTVYVDGQTSIGWTNIVTGYDVGNEFEAQAISAISTTNLAAGTNNSATDIARGTPYYSHQGNSFGQGALYIPSVNDRTAFSGTFDHSGAGAVAPLDGGTYTVFDNNGNPQTITTPNVWLPLKPLVQLDAGGNPVTDSNGNTVPVRPADGKGGVLYGASWVTPSDASDWYIDVIVYDNAVNPYNTRERSNVIIYDNVWGFSTAAPISGLPQDILVVSDYTLGQKFFSSRFGSAPTDDRPARNLQPIFWGAESYYTDTDLRRFPSEQNPQNAPFTGTTVPAILPIWDTNTPFVNGTLPGPFGGNAFNRSGYPNVLGVSSYNDEDLDSSAVEVDASGGFPGYKLPVTGRYSIWRVLSRGPVPAALLQDYLPQVTTAPADIARGETAPRTVLNVNRIVVWASPFTGGLFTGAGSLTDIQTQNDLSAYVQGGGRLLISGQDIGFALAGNGQNNFFFNNILKAQFLSDNAGIFSGLQAATYSGNARYVNQLVQDPWNGWFHAYGRWDQLPALPYLTINQGGPGNNAILRYNYFGPVGAEITGDGALTASGTGGYVDRVRARPSTTPSGLPAGTPPDAVDLFLFPGSPATPAFAAPGTAPAASTTVAGIIASAVPTGFSPIGHAVYDPNRAGQRVGKVVYASVGFESISQGWYNRTAGQQPIRSTLGRRAQLMHNITCHFRTGTITGRVIDNDGKPVNDALIRAVADVADDTQTASGTSITDENGNFQIIGLEPGFYVLYGYKAGFYTQHNLGNLIHGGWRATATVTLKAAGPGALKGVQKAAGQTNPQGGVFSEDGVTPIDGIEVQVRRREVNGQYTLVSAYSSNGTTAVTLPDGSTTQLPAGAYYFPALLISDYQVVANSIFTVKNGQIVEKEVREFTNPNGTVFRAHVNDDGTPVKEQYGEVRIGVSATNQYRLGAGTQVIPDPNPGAAAPIGPTVRISENVTAEIDFLLPAKPQRVTGKVVDQETNLPIRDAIVTATRQSDNTLVAQATTDANGVYTLTKVNAAEDDPDPTLLPGGSYVITASANGYSTTVPPSEVNNVTVVVGGKLETTVTAADIRLKTLPPGSVSGLVRRFSGLQLTTSAVEGATVTFYAVQNVGGQQIQSPNVAYTATVAATPTTGADGYQYNFKIDSVLPGTYNAYVAKPGLSGNPAPLANVTVTTGTETKNINFTLEPPKIYGAGIQLISVPQDYTSVITRDVFGVGQTTDNNGDGVVNDQDLAIYNAFNIADWTGAQYNISPDTRLRLGKGYFVRFGAQSAIATSGVATQTNTYKIDLSRGWNLIGHPFANQGNPSSPASDIDISSPALVTYTYTTNGVQRTNVPLSTAIADNAVQGVLYSYTGSANGSAYQQASRLKQWVGYWVRAYVPVQMTLQYPGGGTRAIKADKRTGGVFKTVSRAEREQLIPRNIESRGVTDWRLQIAARQGDLVDSDNSIGVAPEAQDGFDNAYDHEKPPMMTDAPALYVGVIGKDSTGRVATLSDNVMAPSNTARTWEFSVQTNANGPVTVYWPNVARLPRGLEPMLVDTASGKRVAMRSGSSSYTFTPSGRAEHRFRIEVATASTMPLDILNLRTASRDVGAYGNYRFSFTTTRAVDVNAQIQTLTGKTIKRFQTRATGGSETSLVWDGRDEAGQTLPPGPYVLNVTARDERGASVSRRVSVLKNR